MQIIAGIAAGLPLAVPPGLSVRPTPDRVRKALFDSLGNWQDLVVYDLFAGSGALGLEAASRGAGSVRFLESSHQHAKYLNDNITRAIRHGITAELKLCPVDALRPETWCSSPAPDLVFADPPYAVSGEAYRVLFHNRTFLTWLKSGRVVWELPAGEHSYQEFMELPPGIDRTFRKFGNIGFMMLQIGGKSVSEPEN